MLYSGEQMKKAISEFGKNVFWREYYDNAPSKECKKYIAFKWCFSLFYINEDEREAFVRDRNELEKTLGYLDWEWLYKHCGNNPNKSKYRKKMKELS